MKLDELKELQIDGCEHRNEYPYAVDYPLNYSEPIIKNTLGEFICDKYTILEYNDYEMKFYEDYEIWEAAIKLFEESTKLCCTIMQLIPQILQTELVVYSFF